MPVVAILLPVLRTLVYDILIAAPELLPYTRLQNMLETRLCCRVILEFSYLSLSASK